MKKKHLFKKVIVAALVTIVTLSITACNKDNITEKASKDNITEKPTTEEIVALKAFTMGTAPTAGLDNFYKELDELTIKDLGATIRFDFIAWGDEKTRINLAIASNEYDLYVGGGFSDYKVTATKNAFLDLKPLLNEVPELVSHYSVESDKTLEILEMNGKLFGIPQFNKAGPNTGREGFIYREDLRKEWGLPEITSLETMEQFLYRAKEDERYKEASLITDNRIWTSLWHIIGGGKYMEISSINETPYAVVSYEDPYTVVSMLETPEYKKVLEYAAKWYKDGLIDHDILVASGNEGGKSAELMKSDKKPCETNSPRWVTENSIVGPIYKENPQWELGWYDYTANNGSKSYLPRITNATAISINANSKNAVTALKLIEKAHTNQTYYNLLRFGVLNENYKLVDGNPSKSGIEQNNIMPGWAGLYDGYMEAASTSIDPRWEAITQKMLSENPMPTELDPLDGFIFNTSELSAEVASLETVRTQYMIPVQCGVTKDIDADLANIKQKLEGAGLDKYLEALQKQLSGFEAKKAQ